MLKELFLHGEVKTKLKTGLDKLADMVKITLGPMGRNVIIEQGINPPVITKDGVTVAQQINLVDKVENMGANLVKEVASKTNGAAGDGTTTATVLAQAIVNEGFKVDIDAQRLRREIEEAARRVESQLDSLAVPIQGDAIKHVATISANEAELGELIADAVGRVGKDGVVTVEQSADFGVKIRKVEGLQLNSGYISPYFVTNKERREAEYDDVRVLLVDGKIDNIPDLLPFLEKITTGGVKKLVILAEDFDDAVLEMFVMNKVRGIFQSLLIKTPSFGDRRSLLLDDISLLTGGVVISERSDVKLKDANEATLGTIKRIIASKDSTTIISEATDKEKLDARIKELTTALGNETNDFEKMFLKERLSKLTGGVAVISVGAPSEVEMVEKRHRIEDAVNATKAALEEGIVAGGGATLAYISSRLPGESIGEKVLKNALLQPICQIAENAGYKGSDVLALLENSTEKHGWDAKTNSVVNMFDQGIVDPVKVTRTALKNAVSVAVMILTTEGGITEHIPYAEKCVRELPPGKIS